MHMEIDGGMALPRARLQYELLTQRPVSMKFLHAAAFAVVLMFYLALVNQQSSGKGHGTLGFINPAIYGIGLGSSYAADFHDITSGSNGTDSTEKGYDLVIGWGSPNGVALINALAP